MTLPPRTPRSPGNDGGGGGGDDRAPMSLPARPWSPRPFGAPAAKRCHVDGAPAGRPAMVGGCRHPVDGVRSPVAGWFNRDAGAAQFRPLCQWRRPRRGLCPLLPALLTSPPQRAAMPCC